MENLTAPHTEMQLPQVTFTEKKRQRLQEKRYADPEPRTLKIIEKLRKRLEKLDKQVTQVRLNESKSKIKYWIGRHTAQRVQLDSKQDHLFSEGLRAADMSKRTKDIRNSLLEGFYQTITGNPDLKGRISKTS